MTYRLQFLPEVEHDVRVGRDWYERRSTELGDVFVRAFYSGVDGIVSNPLLYRTFHGMVRRCLLRRFPYAIYFMLEDDLVVVLGLFHCARDPQGVNAQLRRREE